jgi:hypothetical protein
VSKLINSNLQSNGEKLSSQVTPIAPNTPEDQKKLKQMSDHNASLVSAVYSSEQSVVSFYQKIDLLENNIGTEARRVYLVNTLINETEKDNILKLIYAVILNELSIFLKKPLENISFEDFCFLEPQQMDGLITAFLNSFKSLSPTQNEISCKQFEPDASLQSLLSLERLRKYVRANQFRKSILIKALRLSFGKEVQAQAQDVLADMGLDFESNHLVSIAYKQPVQKVYSLVLGSVARLRNKCIKETDFLDILTLTSPEVKSIYINYQGDYIYNRAIAGLLQFKDHTRPSFMKADAFKSMLANSLFSGRFGSDLKGKYKIKVLNGHFDKNVQANIKALAYLFYFGDFVQSELLSQPANLSFTDKLFNAVCSKLTMVSVYNAFKEGDFGDDLGGKIRSKLLHGEFGQEKQKETIQSILKNNYGKAIFDAFIDSALTGSYGDKIRDQIFCSIIDQLYGNDLAQEVSQKVLQKIYGNGLYELLMAELKSGNLSPDIAGKCQIWLGPLKNPSDNSEQNHSNKAGNINQLEDAEIVAKTVGKVSKTNPKPENITNQEIEQEVLPEVSVEPVFDDTIYKTNIGNIKKASQTTQKANRSTQLGISSNQSKQQNTRLNSLKGYAFEQLVGLFLAYSNPSETVIPQYCLIVDLENEIFELRADFRVNLKIVDAKWGLALNNINTTISDHTNAIERSQCDFDYKILTCEKHPKIDSELCVLLSDEINKTITNTSISKQLNSLIEDLQIWTVLKEAESIVCFTLFEQACNAMLHKIYSENIINEYRLSYLEDMFQELHKVLDSNDEDITANLQAFIDKNQLTNRFNSTDGFWSPDSALKPEFSQAAHAVSHEVSEITSSTQQSLMLSQFKEQISVNSEIIGGLVPLLNQIETLSSKDTVHFEALTNALDKNILELRAFLEGKVSK